ncbi:MAG: protein-export chaperone SecB [Cytophagales bacterium]
MSEIVNASFGFSSYKILNFSFNEPKESSENISLFFEPSGIYDETNGEFCLTLIFQAKENDNDNFIITSKIQAVFRFSEAHDFEELPSFFYKNSIAIVFPYLRAFIGSLTIQANVVPIMIPILNLSSIESDFKANVVVKKRN